MVLFIRKLNPTKEQLDSAITKAALALFVCTVLANHILQMLK